ncbi:glucose-1-phosphate thymidylyltransferase RfbA [Streptomyces alkaliphilus]|uniref:glucose-1-phosphate thymidylyltransferase RfbA n=1 Tax=Streptomyces alkaliphilus TaxID=1472722 RepID=UPI00117D0DC6|nr:glucose-1-phosphate thymidylyltransferase RfbA [Streptomyces alkaliphilus]MQS08931.1 glucose-1-phosphate thymidylyltransferase RfbA [Streptomyces alkaliphilus]
MKGIVLAGGSGTRLFPLTSAMSKQLLPVYNKPMVYYPLSVLMLAGIRDILLISAPDAVPVMRSLLGDGSRLGLNLSYAVQEEPRGIAEALLIGADHIDGDASALVLGDNVFHGTGFPELLRRSRDRLDGCALFGSPVPDPERYGIAEVDSTGRVVSLEEKPRQPRSHTAITGLYLYDHEAVDIARGITPSPRGELEITDVNLEYLRRGRVTLTELGRGSAWFDCGTHDSLLAAGQYVQYVEQYEGESVACLEEVALRMGFIDVDACHRLGAGMRQSTYGRHLTRIARTPD